MTTTPDLAEEVTINAPCPSWCTLKAGHPVDSIAGERVLRGHGRDAFGDYLLSGADEYADAPGVLEHQVLIVADGDPLTVSQLLRLASEALAAAAWLEAQA